MANGCVGDGFLVGATGIVSEDPTRYAWPGVFEGCNRLVCHACHEQVRQEAGWAWSGTARPDTKALFAAAELASIEGVVASETGRLYRCTCTGHVEHETVSIEQYRDNERSSVGSKWACGGHPVITLPATIAGVRVDSSKGDAREWVVAAAANGDFHEVAARVCELFFRTRGTAVEAPLMMAISALITDDDPRLRDAALGFYNLAPTIPGAERVGLWAAEQPSLFEGKVPFPIESRYALALVVATKAVEAGRPYEPPVQELLRREALTEQHAAHLWRFLGWHDYAWFAANAGKFPANVADKVNELVKFRGAPR
jgi:hypothetical protein